MRQSLLQLTPSQLWIGKRDPDLFHFTGLKIFGDPIDLGAQESDVVELITLCDLGPHPESVSFEIDSDEISLRMQASQSDRIFSLATGQFQCNGLGIAEVVGPAL